MKSISLVLSSVVTGMSDKKVWFARVNRDLQKHGYTFKQFAENPLYLMSVSKSYEREILSKYSSNNRFTWYNKPTQLSELIKDFPDKAYVKKLLELHPDLKDDMDDNDHIDSDHEGNK